MKHKRLFLAVGAGALILLLITAVLFSSSPRLFSSDAEGTGLTAENVAGDVSIRRGGSNYTLKSGVPLYPGDEILMGRSAACEIAADGRARATLDCDSRVAVREHTDSLYTLEVLEGAVFFDLIRCGPDSAVTVRTAGAELTPVSGAVFSVEAYPGTQTVNMFAGSASLVCEGRQQTMVPGDHVAMVQNDEESSDSTADILASELCRFILDELIARDGLCFETGQLRQIIADRQADALASAAGQPPELMTCTVEIRCDTVLGRENAPAGYPDGVILRATPVKFTHGENAFDVLRRVCRAAGISLDYRYYPTIGGYYVSEIGGLGDSDFGAGSGWLYKVSGWFPNYVASKHEVEVGDVIVWVYTCEGGGADLGREEWMDRPAEG